LGKIKSTADQNGLGWFQDILTLSDPYVPSDPSNDWFVEDIKQKVLESMSDPSSITVLLTGRTVQYKDIIKRILKSAGLVFDEYGLKTGPNITTMKFKIDFISKQVAKYQPNRLRLWEDRPAHAEKFKIGLSQNFPYLKSEIISVESQETYLPVDMELEIIEALSRNSGNKLSTRETIVFSGVFLTDESIALLKEHFPPLEGWTPYYHHMTICMGAISSHPALKLDNKIIGTEVTLKVIAVGLDSRAYAVRVTGCTSNNNIPHITMCIAQNCLPKCSNNIREWEPILQPFNIKGFIKEQIKYVQVQKTQPSQKQQKGGKKINLGKMISDFTTKKGKDIVDAVKILSKWMEDNNIENEDENYGKIRQYIFENLM